MLSLGTSGIVHAEMQTPGQSGWPTVCTRPLDADQLQYGYPGVEQINLGGAYADLQGEEITPVYQWGDPGTTSAVASSIAGAPQITVQSKSDGAIWLPRKLRNGAPISYSLYQYRNIEQTNELASNSVNNGMVCSTFLSWAHLQGGAGYVPAYTYDHALIANAANALFNTVQNACNSGVGFWGGLLSLGAKVRGVAGVVADGPVRDIDEAIGYEFPVFSRSLTSFTARGRVVEKGTNVSVQIGAAEVQAGDYVLADRSAIIFIAERDIERVLDAAETIVAKEAAMAKAILAGTPIGDVMGGNYEHMLKD